MKFMDRVVRWTASRTFVVVEVVVAVVAVQCGQEPPCAGEACEVGGGGGEAEQGGTGGDGGAGGETMTGGGGSGAEGGQGGSGSEETGGGGGGIGGQGGAGGTCEPVGVCDPKACGTVDDCGKPLDCGGCGDPMGCSANACECQAEESPEAAAFCSGPSAEPAVAAYCDGQGGCVTRRCGNPDFQEKVPGACIFSGKSIKPVPQDPTTWVPVWCCVENPS